MTTTMKTTQESTIEDGGMGEWGDDDDDDEREMDQDDNNTPINK